MQELFRSIPAILDKFEQNDQVREALVFTAWRKNAGELLSERSVPVEYIEKRLVVAVADETWRRHLVDLSGQMIFKLNEALGEGIVAFIEFRIDEKTVSAARTEKSKIKDPRSKSHGR